MASVAKAHVSAAASTSDWARGTVVGVLLAAAVMLGRAAEMLDGGAAVLLVVFLVTFAPLGDTVSRRWAVAAGLLPWLGLLWWVRVPTGGPGRVTVLLAAGAGVLGGYIAAAAEPGQRFLKLAPRIRRVDAAPLLSGVAACWPLWPWLSAPDPEHALAVLGSGWDNSAHFAMTDMIVHGGAVTAALPEAFDGSGWGFAEYPQHFHTAVAALMELVDGQRAGGPVQNLVPYAHASTGVLLLSVVAVAAALASLPAAGRRPLMVITLAVLLSVAYTAGPGLRSLQAGHVNFLVAAQTVVIAAALSIRVITEKSWADFAALGGGVVAVANEWMPLAAMAFSTLGWVLLARRWATRAELVAAMSLTVMTVLASLVALPRLLALDVRRVLVLNGAVPMENPYVAVGVPLLAGLAALGAARSKRALDRTLQVADESTSSSRATLGTALVPLAGLSLFAVVLAYQVERAGYPSYYSIKILNGTMLASWGIAAIAVLSMPIEGPPRRRPAGAAVCAVLLLSVVASGISIRGTGPQDDGTGEVAAARRLLQAARTAEGLPPGRSFYLGTAPGDLPLTNGDQWLTALTRSWTRTRSEVDVSFTAAVTSTDDMIRTTRRLLTEQPSMFVIVSPTDVGWLRRDLPDQANRIVTWA